MSAIGSPASATLTLAGSIVGSSRPEVSADRSKAASADQKAQADRQTTLANTLDDIGESEMGTDRDADGRQAYRHPDQPAGSIGDNRSPSTSRTSVDAFGNSGNKLDSEA